MAKPITRPATKSAPKPASVPAFLNKIVTLSQDDFGSSRPNEVVATCVSAVSTPYKSDNSRGYWLIAEIVWRMEDGSEYTDRVTQAWFGQDQESKLHLNGYPGREIEIAGKPYRVICGPPELSFDPSLSDEENEDRYNSLLDRYLAMSKGEYIIPDDELVHYQGPYVVTVNRQTKLKETDWTQIVQSVKELFKDEADSTGQTYLPPFDAGNDRTDVFVGYKFFLIQEEKLYRSKKDKAENPTSSFTVLCANKLFGPDEEFLAELEAAEIEAGGSTGEAEAVVPASRATKKATAALAPAPEPEDEIEAGEETEAEAEEGAEAEEEEAVTDDADSSVDSFEARVDAEINKALNKLGKPSARNSFNGAVVATFKDKKEQTRALTEFLNNTKWMVAPDRTFGYDKKTGLFYGV